MKTITNKLTSIPTGKAEPSFEDYFSLAKICLNQPPQGGFDVAEMAKRLRVMDALVGDQASLEDADYETLKACVNVARWGVLHRDIKEFADYIKAPAG